jgi:hypothetical protein
MWSTIILVKLHTHLQIISIKKQEIIFCMHTKVHTHTHTNIQTHLTYMHECSISYYTKMITIE